MSALIYLTYDDTLFIQETEDTKEKYKSKGEQS